MIYLNHNRRIELQEWNEFIGNLSLRDKLKSAKRILIKPNFAAGGYVDPKNHVVSDLSFLSNIIQLAHQTNPEAEIVIAESDSTGHGFAYAKFEHLGLPDSLDLPSDIDVCLLDMTRDRLLEVEDSRFKYYKDFDHQLWLSEKLLQADFVISLSNLKMHTVTGYTGACKNLFGCLPDFDKSSNHTHIHKIIHDLVLAIKPQLSVVDAFYGMEGNGPVQGQDVDSGYRVFSEDPVEADIYAAYTVGYDPYRIGYIKHLCKTEKKEKMMNPPQVVREYKRAGRFVRVMNAIGVCIQRVGQGIASFGHRIHACTNPIQLGIVIVRPILLKMFSIEKLREMKRKLIK
jgi:uncharacterized protein (DUF362 family)